MIDRPYKCKVDIALPSPVYAQHIKDVISVDGELGNKIVKSFSIVEYDEGGALQVLRMYVSYYFILVLRGLKDDLRK